MDLPASLNVISFARSFRRVVFRSFMGMRTCFVLSRSLRVASSFLSES